MNWTVFWTTISSVVGGGGIVILGIAWLSKRLIETQLERGLQRSLEDYRNQLAINREQLLAEFVREVDSRAKLMETRFSMLHAKRMDASYELYKAVISCWRTAQDSVARAKSKSVTGQELAHASDRRMALLNVGFSDLVLLPSDLASCFTSALLKVHRYAQLAVEFSIDPHRESLLLEEAHRELDKLQRSLQSLWGFEIDSGWVREQSTPLGSMDVSPQVDRA